MEPETVLNLIQNSWLWIDCVLIEEFSEPNRSDAEDGGYENSALLDLSALETVITGPCLVLLGLEQVTLKSI